MLLLLLNKLTRLFYKNESIVTPSKITIRLRPRFGKLGSWVWNHLTNKRVIVGYTPDKETSYTKFSNITLDEPVEIGLNLNQSENFDLSKFKIYVDNKEIYRSNQNNSE